MRPPKKHYETEADREAILAYAAPALLPLLEERSESALSQLLGEFYAGTQDLRPTVAMIAAYRNLIRDINLALEKRDSTGGA